MILYEKISNLYFINYLFWCQINFKICLCTCTIMSKQFTLTFEI